MLNRVLGIATLGALFGGTGLPVMAYRQPGTTVNASKNRKRGMFNGWLYPSVLIGTKGAGITVAHAKRAAKKKRTKARHKAACRG